MFGKIKKAREEVRKAAEHIDHQDDDGDSVGTEDVE
jgi:hypothetical protein